MSKYFGSFSYQNEDPIFGASSCVVLANLNFIVGYPVPNGFEVN